MEFPTEEIRIERDTCTPVFIAALFTIVKTWKQPKCPSTKEWIKKMWYIYTMKYYSAIQKNKMMPFAAIWMDLGIVILSEVTTGRQTKCPSTEEWIKKMWYIYTMVFCF